MPKKTIVVMGATGNIGRALVQELAARGHDARALSRDPKKGLPAASDDAAALAKAFSGADAVWAMIPPDYARDDFGAWQDRAGEAVADALRRARPARVVALSSVGAQHPAGTGPIKGLHRQEKRLDALGLPSLAHLRPSFFMENHLWSIGTIKGAGINGSPMRPELALAQVATADIAWRAAELLDAAPPGRAVHEFGGPREITPLDVTKALGAAIGRPDLKYVQFPYADAEKAMLGLGMKPSIVALMIEMHRGMNEGLVAPERPLDARGTTSIEAFAARVFAPAFNA